MSAVYLGLCMTFALASIASAIVGIAMSIPADPRKRLSPGKWYALISCPIFAGLATTFGALS